MCYVDIFSTSSLLQKTTRPQFVFALCFVQIVLVVSTLQLCYGYRCIHIQEYVVHFTFTMDGF